MSDADFIKFPGSMAGRPETTTAAADALARGADRVERSGALTLATFSGGVVELTQSVLGDYFSPHGLQAMPDEIQEATEPNTWIRYQSNSLPLSALLRAKEEGDQKWLDDVRPGIEEAGHDFAALIKQATDEAEKRRSVVTVAKEDVEAARQTLGCSDEAVEAPKAEKITIQVSGSELRRLKAFLNTLPEEFYRDAYPIADMGRLVSPAELIGNPALGGPETFTAG